MNAGNNDISLSMLQLTNDTMIITLKSILRCFELESDLKVNFHRSRVGGIGVQAKDIQRYSILINRKIITLSFTY